MYKFNLSYGIRFLTWLQKKYLYNNHKKKEEKKSKMTIFILKNEEKNMRNIAFRPSGKIMYCLKI